MAQVIEPTAGTDLGGLFEVVVKVRSEDTNGVLAAIEQTVPPRKLLPPHTHENAVWVYVLTGEIGILVGDEVEHAGAGSWALSRATWCTRCGTALTPPHGSSKC